VNTTDAVKALRAHLGQSQQAFATGLGLSIRAIANYEKDRTPSTFALERLRKAAQESRRGDLADVFDAAYWQNLRRRFPGLTDEESAWTELMCDILDSQSVLKLKPVWRDVRESLLTAARKIISEAKRTQEPALLELASSVQGHMLIALAPSIEAAFGVETTPAKKEGKQ
jgi:transcriptional regulator with XRE-family HTH domain